MTRQDYIMHLDTLRKGLSEVMEYEAKTLKRLGKLSNPEPLEEERAKKTAKMFEDLSVRLYEDAAVSERIKQDKILKGELQQAEITFPDLETKGGAE